MGFALELVVGSLIIKQKPWSKLRITLDTYSNVAPGLQQAAAVRFDDICNSKAKKETTEINY